MEEFVSYEIALKLKKKGFSEECLHHYINGFIKSNACRCDYKDGIVTTEDLMKSANYIVEQFEFVKKDDIIVDAPTISHVLKWLRDEKGIYIIIQPYSIMAFENKVAWDWSFKHNSNGAYMEHAYPSLEGYETYEHAAIKAIEYVLDNLI